jgi:mono/diheme cytochrome c family protein
VGIDRHVGRTGFRSAARGGPQVGPPYVPAVALAILLVSIALNGRAQVPATVKDKVYTTEQAERGEKSFKQVCAKCHLFDGPVTKDGPPLGGDVFITKWDGKSVFEMAVGIRLNMPPDGSVILEDNETADLVAYILKANGFPDGDKPLKADVSAKSLIFVKNK